MSEISNTSLTATTKTWPKEQTWIKDVLSKSGTELVQLSPNKAVKITKKVVKQNEKNSQHNTTMVYYPSTPLIIKSEEPSQAQMCTPLRNHHELRHTTQQLQSQTPTTTTIATNNSYMLNNVNITTIQHHQQQMSHNINSKSITKNHHQTLQQQQQQPQYLTNIKTELLPPGITLYASTQPASLTIKAAATQSSIPPANNVSSSTTISIPTAAARKTNTNKPQFKCEQCGMTFGSKSAHTSHTKSHAKNAKLNLITSGNGNSSSGVENSIATVTSLELIKPNTTIAATSGGDPYQCNVCQKTFAVPARLIRHYRTHTGERPFECEFCQKLFSVKENLQVHRRIHTKERPYKCDICERAFEHSGKLHRHMRIHTGERPHKCSVCDKTFIQSGQLVIHMRTHTGEKPYKCPVEGCGKGFTCSKQLKVHSRTHTGEKPYHCDICFRDFGYNHVLKLHRVQHYGARCYKCTICDETFKSKKEMEAHIKKAHVNEMPEDDEEVNANGNGTQTSTSGAESNSGPNSPQSPSSTTTKKNGKTTKPRKQKMEKETTNEIVRPTSPRSTGSPISSSMSPSPTRLSPDLESLSLDADHHSRDSGVAIVAIPSNNTRQLAAASLVDLSHQGGFPISDEMPTDLSITQNHHMNEEHKFQLKEHHRPQQTPLQLSYPQYQSSPSPQHQTHHLAQQQQQQQQQYHYLNNDSTSPSHVTELHHTSISPSPQHHLHYEQQHQPTINPALLEAATIASRREDDVEQAAIQIMQLRHSQHKSNSNHIYNDLQQQQQHSSTNNIVHHNKSLIIQQQPQQQRNNTHIDMVKSMVMNNLNENLIEQYTRDELSRHAMSGLSKGYAPVPKFEPSLHDNEIILRQVEAAIAPLRSSTTSPDRSSSPECDLVLVSDRDVMTLPLRKRKLYMSDCNEAAGDNPNSNQNKAANKVVRHNSVIQFAKAS